MNRAMVAFVFGCMPFWMFGCSPMLRVNFTNGTARRIEAKSSHTGKMYAIEPNSSRAFPHGVGDLIVVIHTQGSDERYRYRDVSAAGIDRASVTTGGICLEGPIAATLHVLLQPDLKLCVVMPERQASADKAQPSGYPKEPASE